MCEAIKIGNSVAIVCGARKKKCHWCGAPCTRLCDFSVGENKTCDAPMCDAHATGKSPDIDYCPEHAGHSHYRTSSPSTATNSSMWPATAEELRSSGWIDQKKSKWCSCGKVLFWFLTPQKKWIPLEAVSEAMPVSYRPHHANCRDVKNFRTAERPKPKTNERPVRPAQTNLFG